VFFHENKLDQALTSLAPDQPLPLPEEGGALLWFRLGDAGGERIDLNLPFSPENGAWGYTQQRVPVSSEGKEMTGRQAFPSLMVFDGTVAAWRSDELAWPEHFENPPAEVRFICGSNKGGIVHSAIELLRLKCEAEHE
jgi:hypothetical protein